MKKLIHYLFAFFMMFGIHATARDIKGAEANKMIPGASMIRLSETSSIPDYIKFREGSQIPFNVFEKWIHGAMHLSSDNGFVLLNSETDMLGMQHYRYRQTINGIPVEGSMFLLHVKDGMINSMNGQLYDRIQGTSGVSIQ